MLKSFLKPVFMFFILISFVFSGLALAEDKKQEENYGCVFENENSPKISLEAEKKYEELELMYSEIFQDFNFEVQEANESDHFKNIINLLEENKETNWQIKYGLACLYLAGFDGENNKEKGPLYFKQLIEAGITVGYYGLSWSLEDPKEKRENLEKAAQLGSPVAQSTLGRMVLNRIQEAKTQKEAQNDYNFAFNNLICASRQGLASSAYEIADYLNNKEKNYVLAMQYYWQSAILGDYRASLFLYTTFASDISSTKVSEAETISESIFLPLKGYKKNDELAKKFAENMELLSNYQPLYGPNRKQKIADFSGLKIPNNTLMTREEALKKDSKIKEAFNGRWPHELYSLF